MLEDIPDDPHFRTAVNLLESVTAHSLATRGYLLAVFVNKFGDAACDLHFHQNASEQMVAVLLQTLFNDPQYQRVVEFAIEEKITQVHRALTETVGSA